MKKQNNMKLEQQVVSLELAQKLKELGVKQESLFYHRKGVGIVYSESSRVRQAEQQGDGVFCSAFTVAELGEMLPFYVEKNEHTYYFYTIQTAFGEFIVEYANSDWGTLKFTREDTEADARAKMLIYLLENGLITP